MSIHYLHIILVVLIALILAKTPLRTEKVKISERQNHCYSQLAYLKNDEMIYDSCEKYISHLRQFPNSTQSVQPQDFIVIPTPNPIQRLPRYDLPFYFSSKEEEVQTLQALIRETEVHYIQANDAKDYDVSDQSKPTNHTDLTINIEIDLPITLVLENTNYINWNLTGKIHNVKAIFVKNSYHTTLSKEIKLNHIYTSKLKNSMCTQCRGLHLEEVSFHFSEADYSDAFVVQNFNPHVRVHAKTITIKDNSHMDY